MHVYVDVYAKKKVKANAMAKAEGNAKLISCIEDK